VGFALYYALKLPHYKPWLFFMPTDQIGEIGRLLDDLFLSAALAL
jgi:hypothetical protein